MNNLCDLCLRDTSQCKNQIAPCNYIPKYNLCPICKEKTIVYEPRCYKCGYDFKAEIEEQEEIDDYRDRLDELEREEYYESKYGKEQE